MNCSCPGSKPEIPQQTHWLPLPSKLYQTFFPLRHSKLMAFSSTYRPGMTFKEDDSLRRLFNTNADSMAIFGKRSAFTIILYKLLCVRWSIHWTICLQSTSQMKKSEQLHKRTRYLFLFLCFLKILLQFSFHSL